ncbi:MAG: hypothetical protein NC131_19775 [Roseburia sp.]|nr:hypothetical protein [Roseburia sp.]
MEQFKKKYYRGSRFYPTTPFLFYLRERMWQHFYYKDEKFSDYSLAVFFIRGLMGLIIVIWACFAGIIPDSLIPFCFALWFLPIIISGFLAILIEVLAFAVISTIAFSNSSYTHKLIQTYKFKRL